ncbi:Endocytosis and vacuole integrity protein [Coemansia sp. RSA 1813]|nr:Endocytosis and vacuole integrity protein [Coemansia sp. RSA 1646]KAJ1771974.1 Endocytosis and vacuole integrity protein [Coemansia sp. RSA 1843]KAJ2214249.1 Endocytosis and vacuole integrity protein [Coemansia sp. RSA 487]KAJ2569667.1 Endocytosis and vacuole integrity protein [Coemansia sp. RSA 1813]
MATTNLGTLLLTELQNLSTEARRKHPDVKEAAERVIVVLRGINSTVSLQIASELAKSEQVIRPFVLACRTSNQKLIAAAVQCMQLLISHQAISPGSIRESLNTLNSVLGYGIDIQVKVLQMVLPLVSRYADDVYGETLVEAFHICIALQRSKDPIVSNTAAAMLRQIVVSVFDRVVTEDQELGKDGEDDGDESTQARDTSEQDMTRRYAKDAFFVLQDLCLLAAESEPIFIRDSLLDKGLVLELIESVLVNHAHVVSRHTAMAQILRERLAPFFVNFFAEKASFTLAVRCIRIVWLFIRNMHQDFIPECEIFISVLTRLIDPGSGSAGGPSAASNRSAPGSRRGSISGQRSAAVTMLSAKAVASGSSFPLFYRVLAMEIVRNVMRSSELLHQLYLQYDGQGAQGNDETCTNKGEDCHVVRDMISAVSRLASEKPDIRADSAEGIPNAFTDSQIADFVAGNPGSGTAAAVAAATSGGALSAASGKASAEALSTAKATQIGTHNSCMRTEMHQLLDKQDPPNIPDTYLFYLSLSAIAGAVDGISMHALSIYSRNLTCSTDVSRIDVKGASHQIKQVTIDITESVLDTETALESEEQKARTISDIAVHSWPMLLSAYLFFLGVRLDDGLFNQVIDTMQKLVQVCGALGLVEARNAILTLMCRSCLPQTAIADHEKYVQSINSAKSSPALAPVPESTVEDIIDSPRVDDEANPNPKQYARPLVTESLVGLPFTINARQVQCLRAIVSSAIFLAPVLGPMWYPVLVTMQQAEEVLYQSNRGVQTSLHGGSGGSASAVANGTAGASSSGGRSASSRRVSVSSGSMPAMGTDGSFVLPELIVIHDDYAKLFAFVRVSGKDSFAWAVRALCLLGSDLSSVPIWSPLSDNAVQMRAVTGLLHRRISAAMHRPTFAVEELREFAVSNVDVLLGATTDAFVGGSEVQSETWSAIMYHLLGTATFVRTPSPIRTQACEALSAVVLAAMELVSRVDVARSDGEDADDPKLSKEFAANVATGDIQLRILTPLSQMMTGQIPSASSEFGQFIEVRKLALDTLHRLLQASGHSIKHAWSVVFDIIHSVLDDLSSSSLSPKHASARNTNSGSGSVDSKQLGQLMRCVFPCLQLICTDYLEDLPAHCLRRCIESLECFGRQTEDLNISLTAIGQAWALCDFLQTARQRQESVEGNVSATGFTSSALAQNNNTSADESSAIEALSLADTALEPIVGGWWSEELGELETARTQQVLWVLLLHSLSVLGRDPRHEVRLGAIQTLFRTLDMHGDTFDPWEWDSIVWVVVLPLVGYTLEQRAYVFELIANGRLDELPDATAASQESKAQMASKSGVFIEDPAMLYSKQWDETAATTLQGAAKTWSDQSTSITAVVWRIGFASQAWSRMWQLVANFLIGRMWLQCGYLPNANEPVRLETPKGFVSGICEQALRDANNASAADGMRSYLRSRSSVTAAIDCASVLAGSESSALPDADNDAAALDTERLRIAWLAWLSMAVYLTSTPDSAGAEFNQDAQGRVIITQDVLGSLLSLCATIVSKLCSQLWFDEADCMALITTARRLVAYVDAPLSALDAEATTPVQERLLGILDRVLEVSREKSRAGDAKKLVTGDAAVALVLSELTVLAVAPYVVQGQQIESSSSALVLASHAVYRRAESAFSVYCQRVAALDSLQDLGTASSSAGGAGGSNKERRQKRSSAGARTKKRTIRASFVALGEAALRRLGHILCIQNNEEGSAIFGSALKDNCTSIESSSAMRVLLHGIWQDAIVAIGWHLVVPLALVSIDGGAWDRAMAATSVAADWFVRVVPTGMKELGLLAASMSQELGSSAREALASAWVSVGSVVGLVVEMPTDSLASLAGALAITRHSAGSLGGNDEVQRTGNGCARDNVICKLAASSTDRQSSDDCARGGSTLSASTQIEILDAVAGASLQYVAACAESSQQKQPEETEAYWQLLVGILEWGALRVSEPVVVLGIDIDVPAQSSGVGREFHQNRQALTMACFKWLFLMSSAVPAPTVLLQSKEIPQWVSKAAAPTLVRRIKVVLETFVQDKALVGNSPMPLSQIELLRFILQELAQLQCQPGALNCLLAKLRKEGADNGGMDKAGLAFREHALAGTTAHIFAMYDSLVNLLSVSDTAVLRSVQMCLHRVSAEIFK